MWLTYNTTHSRYNPVGVEQREQPKRLTTESKSTILTDLRSNSEYEVAVQLVLPDGRRSPWSPKHLTQRLDHNVNTPIDSAAEWELCDFEDTTMCDFINDPTATIDWKREEQLIGSHFARHLSCFLMQSL